VPDYHKKRPVFQATQITVSVPFVLPASDPPLEITLGVGDWRVDFDGEFFAILTDADFQAQYEPV
jgi:hypothetical protein